MHRVTPLLRATRALVGLVTIWCLGCTGYEPLMDRMLGSDGGAMTCGSVLESPASTDASPSSVSEPTHTAGQIALSAQPTHRGFECGCGGSCHATSPTPLTAHVAHPVVHGVAQRQPSEPASVSRVPLLPPPEFGA
jgi:hypothetical protein